MASLSVRPVLLIALFVLVSRRVGASEEHGGLRRSAEFPLAENTSNRGDIERELPVGWQHQDDNAAMGMTWIEPEELPLDVLRQHPEAEGRDLQMMGCGEFYIKIFRSLRYLPKGQYVL